MYFSCFLYIEKAFTSGNSKINLEQLLIFWNAWVKLPKNMLEFSELFYELLRRIITEFYILTGPVCPYEDLAHFFTTEICNPDLDFSLITVPIMKVLEILLICVNKHLKNIIVKAGQSNLLNNQQSDQPDEFEVKIKPSEIKGISVLWKIALEAKNESVAMRAIEFLNKLHTKLAPELEDKVVIISREFIETAGEKLGKLHEGLISGKHHTSEIIKVLKLIEEMIDESEKKGNACITPLYALYKSDLYKIRILNLIVSSLNKEIFSQKPQNEITINLPSNLTLWQLKCFISKEFHISPDSVFL